MAEHMGVRPARWHRWWLVANGIGGVLGPSLASAFDVLAPGKGPFVACVLVFAVLVPALVVARGSGVQRR
jgi:hypothetical protein